MGQTLSCQALFPRTIVAPTAGTHIVRPHCVDQTPRMERISPTYAAFQMALIPRGSEPVQHQRHGAVGLYRRDKHHRREEHGGIPTAKLARCGLRTWPKLHVGVCQRRCPLGHMGLYVKRHGLCPIEILYILKRRAHHFLQHGLVRNFAQVRALDLGGNTHKSLTQSLLRRRVEHFLLHLGFVRRPCEEANLVALTLITLLKLKVVDGIAAFRRWKLSKEIIVVGRVTRLGHNNLSIVWRKRVDDVLGLSAQLQRLKLLKTLLAYFYTRRLPHARKFIHPTSTTYHIRITNVCNVL